MEDFVLETKGLTKHYGGVHALEGADFQLKKGEHVAIMGDNGAGKSTFVRQITGVEQRTSGSIVFGGKEVNFRGPIDAREAGIETVFQTLALADHLDVSDNIFLGRERTKFNWLGPFRILDYKAMREDTLNALEKTAVKIPNIATQFRICLVVSVNVWRLPEQRVFNHALPSWMSHQPRWCAGNRAGGKYHPQSETGRRAAYPC